MFNLRYICFFSLKVQFFYILYLISYQNEIRNKLNFLNFFNMQAFVAFKKNLNEYLEFSIGTSQITLNKDHQWCWCFVRTMAAFQSVGIIFLWQSIIRDIGGEIIHQNDFEVVFNIAIPTTFIFKFESVNLLFFAQSFIIAFLITIPIMNIVMMRQQRILYDKHKLSQKTKINQIVDDSLSLKQVKLTLLYGHSTYMNFWFQNGYLQGTQYSFTNLTLKVVCYITNTFSDVILLPLSIFAIYILAFYNVKQHPFTQVAWLQVISAIQLLLTIIFSYISVQFVSQSLSVDDPNFLHLSSSFGITVKRWVQIMAILYPPFQIKIFGIMNDTPRYVMIVLILIGEISQLFDFYYSIPYVRPYKRNLDCVLLSFTITACVLYAFVEDLGEFLTKFIFVTPLLAYAFKQYADHQMNRLMLDQFVVEKSQNVQSKDADSKNLVSGAYIRRVIQKMKEIQIFSFQGSSFTKFPHVLNIINRMNLERGELYVRSEVNDKIKHKTKDPLKSRTLILTQILLSRHQEQCENIYCYCKGFRGENKSINRSRDYVENMCVNADLTYFSISFYSEFVFRFLRNYSKTVFYVEKDRSFVDLILIIQLINYVSSSDECIQSVLLALDFAAKLGHLQQSITAFELLSIGYLINWIRFNILFLFNQMVQPDQLELIFVYEDYRSSEKKRNKVFLQLVKNIYAKIDYLQRLGANSHSYEHILNLYQDMNCVNDRTSEIIAKFRSRNNSKTSLLCDVFFQLEVLNNYGKFQRLLTKLRSFEEKFFEFPQVFYKIEAFSNEVCYLKVDLNVSKSGDSFNGIISRGWIRDFSRNCPGYFNYTQSEFQQLKNVRELVPPSTCLIHDDFIETVLLTARPFVLRARIPLFIKTKEGFMLHTEFFADFNFKLYGGEFTIYIFLKKIKEKGRNGRLKNYFWIHKDGGIEGITQNVLESLEIDDPNCEYLYQMQMSQLIPEFTSVSLKLEQMLDKQIKYQQSLKGQDTTEISSTFASLQMINSIKLENTNLYIPAELTANNVQKSYQLDCIIYLKHAQLIGRVYKVYLIEFLYFTKIEAEEMHRLSKSPMGKTTNLNKGIFSNEMDDLLKYSEVPQEFEDLDYRIDNFIYFPINGTQRTNFLRNEMIMEGPLINDDFYKTDNQNESHYNRCEQSRNDSKLSKTQQQQFYATSDKGINHSKSSFLNASQMQKEEEKLKLQIEQFNESQSQGSTAASSAYGRFITKSNYYYNFVKKDKSPSIVKAFNVFNTVSFFAKVAFMIAFMISVIMWASDLKLGLGSADVFTTINYNSVVSQSLFFQQRNYSNIAQSKLNQLKTMLKDEITEFTDNYRLIKDSTQNSLLLKKYRVKVYDVFNKNYSYEEMWLAMDIVFYHMTSLERDINNEVSIVFLLQTYNDFKRELSAIQQSILDQVQNKKNILKVLANYLLITVWCCLALLTLISFFLHTNLYDLFNKLLRCSEQISFTSIAQELVYMQRLIDQFQINTKKNIAYIDIYGLNYDLKEKILQLSQSDSRSFKTSMNFKSSGNKKNIILQQKLSPIRRGLFMLPILPFFGFAVIFSVLCLNLTTQSQIIQGQISSFQLAINISESFSSMVLQQQLLGLRRLNKIKFLKSNITQQLLVESFQNLTTDVGRVIDNQAEQFSSDFQSLFQDDLCDTIFNSYGCVSNQQKEVLSQGLYVALTHYIQMIRQVQFNQITYDDILSACLITQILENFTNFKKIQTFQDVDILNRSSLDQIIGLGVLFIVIQLFTIYHSYVWIRVKYLSLKKFVFVVPPFSLYIEESFFKTLLFISQQEYQLMD